MEKRRRPPDPQQLARLDRAQAFIRSRRQLKALLALWGIQFKGFEFRGVRRALPRYVACTPAPRHGWLIDPPERTTNQAGGGPYTEKRQFVDQLAAPRLPAIEPTPTKNPVIHESQPTPPAARHLPALAPKPTISPLLSGAFSCPPHPKRSHYKQAVRPPPRMLAAMSTAGRMAG
jgi:hypothetical protein